MTFIYRSHSYSLQKTVYILLTYCNHLLINFLSNQPEGYFLFSFLHRKYKFRICVLLCLQQNVYGQIVQEWHRNPGLCFTFYQAIITFQILFVGVFAYIYHICHMLTNNINLVIPKSKYNFDLFVYMTL